MAHVSPAGSRVREAEGHRAGAVTRKKQKGTGGRSVDPFENKPPNLLGPEDVRERAQPRDQILTDLKTKEDW